jgi:2'-phosphotransferase
MRNSADILIYIDLKKALDAGIKFFLSANGVVLTAGDDTGFLKPEFFSRVEDKKGVPLPGWDGNKASTTQEPGIQSIEATLPTPTKADELAADTLITKEALSGSSTPAI